MPSALCLLHANCQGDALRPLLENSPAFNRLFQIRQYTNYTRQSIAEADLEPLQTFFASASGSPLGRAFHRATPAPPFTVMHGCGDSQSFFQGILAVLDQSDTLHRLRRQLAGTFIGARSCPGGSPASLSARRSGIVGQCIGRCRGLAGSRGGQRGRFPSGVGARPFARALAGRAIIHHCQPSGQNPALSCGGPSAAPAWAGWPA